MAVALLRSTRRVVGESVDLYDDAMCTPAEIGFETMDPHVDPRGGELRGPHECEEPFFRF